MNYVMSEISVKFKAEIHAILFNNPWVFKVFMINKCEDVLLNFLHKISEHGKIDELFAV